jgi:hypothetical protein
LHEEVCVKNWGGNISRKMPEKNAELSASSLKALQRLGKKTSSRILAGEGLLIRIIIPRPTISEGELDLGDQLILGKAPMGDE